MTTAENPQRFLGTTYHGTGDLDLALDALESALATAGMRSRRETLIGGAVHLTATQDAPWYRIVARRLPQRADWRLTADGDRLSISGDFLRYRWNVALISCLGFAILLCFLGAILSFARESGFGWPTVTGMGVAGTGLLLFVILATYFFGEGHHREDIWQTVLYQVEHAGGLLEPRGRSISRRKGITIIGLVTSLLSMAGWAITDTLLNGYTAVPITDVAGLVIVLSLILILAFFLILIAWLMFHQAEINYRTTAVQTGVATVASVLLFFSPVLLWLSVSVYPEIPTRMKNGEILLGGRLFPEAGYGTAAEKVHQRTLQTYRALQVWGWEILVVTVFMIGFAIAAFLFYAVYRSIYTARILARFQCNRERGLYRQATRGGSFLRRFRTVFVASWVLFSAVVLSVLGMLLLSALQVFVPIFSSSEIRLADLTAAVVSYAAARPIGEGMLDAAVRGGWVVYAALGLGLFLVSVGQLAVEERRERRRLRRTADITLHPRQREWQRVLDYWTADIGVDPVRLVVSPDRPPGADARSFGFWRSQRYVEIAAACVDHMNAEEVRALLAHELSHHRAGDCRRDQLLRWLGRLSFVGDGFVLALQNSWASEDKADTAVEELGVTPETLYQALETLRTLHPVWMMKHQRQSSGRHIRSEDLAELDAVLKVGPSAMPVTERWRRAWSLFRHQYFHGTTLHYWHPPDFERGRRPEPEPR